MAGLKNILIAAAIFVVCGLLCTQSFYYGKRIGAENAVESIESTPPDTLFIYDTIVQEKPVPRIVEVIDTVLREIRDTVWIDGYLYEEWERERKIYAGDGYWCQVSGIEAQLDSIRVKSTTAYIERPIIREIEVKQKVTFGVHLGIGAQYGLIRKQFDVGPYVGIGVQYNF